MIGSTTQESKVFYFMEKEKGCVYFFRHIGLTPIKIGFSKNPSPINRFNQFKTYAPFGSEIVGFIQVDNPKDLESLIHSKYNHLRLEGEWFEITEEQAIKEIDFYSKLEDIKARNEFQIEWAKKINLDLEKNNEIKNLIDESSNKFDNFRRLYKLNKNLHKKTTSMNLGVARQTIYNWIKIIES